MTKNFVTIDSGMAEGVFMRQVVQQKSVRYLLWRMGSLGQKVVRLAQAISDMD